MLRQYIQENIKIQNDIIDKNFDGVTFTLNKAIRDALEEIERLQNQCEHEFDENGVCVICGKERND